MMVAPRGDEAVVPVAASRESRRPERRRARCSTCPFRSAKQLAAAIRKKKIGCLELLDLYLERVEKHNPALNAIIATDVEGARKRARAADRALAKAARRGARCTACR